MRTLEEILASNKVTIKHSDSEGFQGTYTTYKWIASVICTWGAGWEHVSISPYKHKYMPTWEEMCTLKDIFFNDDEAVIQIHPPKADYVDNLSNCLHLWRCKYKDMVLPPSCLVGIRKGQSMEELKEEVRNAYALAGEVYEG